MKYALIVANGASLAKVSPSQFDLLDTFVVNDFYHLNTLTKSSHESWILVDPHYYTTRDVCYKFLYTLKEFTDSNKDVIRSVAAPPPLVSLIQNYIGNRVICYPLGFTTDGLTLLAALKGVLSQEKLPSLNQNVVLAAALYVLSLKRYSHIFFLGLDFKMFTLHPNNFSPAAYSAAAPHAGLGHRDATDLSHTSALDWAEMQRKLTSQGRLLCSIAEAMNTVLLNLTPDSYCWFLPRPTHETPFFFVEGAQVA